MKIKMQGKKQKVVTGEEKIDFPIFFVFSLNGKCDTFVMIEKIQFIISFSLPYVEWIENNSLCLLRCIIHVLWKINKLCFIEIYHKSFSLICRNINKKSFEKVNIEKKISRKKIVGCC